MYLTGNKIIYKYILCWIKIVIEIITARLRSLEILLLELVLRDITLRFKSHFMIHVTFSGKLSSVGQGDLKVNDSTTVACQQMKLNYNRNYHIQNK